MAGFSYFLTTNALAQMGPGSTIVYTTFSPTTSKKNGRAFVCYHWVSDRSPSPRTLTLEGGALRTNNALVTFELPVTSLPVESVGVKREDRSSICSFDSIIPIKIFLNHINQSYVFVTFNLFLGYEISGKGMTQAL